MPAATSASRISRRASAASELAGGGVTSPPEAGSIGPTGSESATAWPAALETA